MDTDNLKQLNHVRLEVCRRRKELDFLAQQPFTNRKNARDQSSQKGIACLDLQPATAVPLQIRLQDLLQYDDRNFVLYAYRCILKRDMDPGGEWYVDKLRSGKSKIDVLIRLRYGPEGKSQGVRIRGLKKYRILFRFAKLPVLGFLFRIATYCFCLVSCFLTLPRKQRKQEASKQYMMSLFTKVESYVNDSRTCIVNTSEQFSSKLCRMESDVQTVLRRENVVSCKLNEIETTNLNLEPISNEINLTVERVSQLEPSEAELREARQKADALKAVVTGLEVISQRLSKIENRKPERELHSDQLAQIRPLKVKVDVISRRLDEIAPIFAGQDEFYASLEDRFRGSTEEIRKRQEHYVSFVQAAEAGIPEAPVLDIGCGRGEWLSLLQDHGKTAYGIELNEVFLARCRQEKLNVRQDEALQHLESLVPASLGAITGFHVIEHLPTNQPIRLVQLAFRALRPGGVLILETPNPEHLSVAALRFYLDPTHVRPIPPALLEFIARHAGFDNVRIEHRGPSRDGEAAQGWSRFQDYAVIAVRPKDDSR